MNIVAAATRAVTRTADMTTAAAGAIGGAAVSGAVGAAQGAVSGVRAGLDNGSRSSAAAALTIGALGAAGLVEWPVLLTVGGAALVIHQLGGHARDRSDGDPAPTLKPVPDTAESEGVRRAPRSTTRNTSPSRKKATAPRRATKK